MRRIAPYALVAAFSFAAGSWFTGVARAREGAEAPLQVVEQLARVLVLVEGSYVDPVEREKLLTGAIKGMVAELDPHSAYMPPEDNALFNSETQGRFGGVGLEVELRDERVIVIAPIEGSPAFRAGIKPGERITAVAGEPTRGSSLEKLIKKLRGVEGTSIEITVVGDDDKPRNVTLVREQIKVPSVVGKRLDGDIAYVKVRQFQATTHDDFMTTAGRVRKESSAPLQGVVLDLRGNPGGLVDQATAVADELLDDGVIFTTRHRGRVVETVTASSGGAFAKLPIVVLVNENSASAAELVAAALQDHGRAKVVGAQTFGKGSVQSIIDLPQGAGLKLTTMRYFSPQGRVIQANGVTPDLVVAVKGDKEKKGLRERDLEGHLSGDDGQAKAPPSPASSTVVVQAPPKPEGREPLGAGASRVPNDPSKGDDAVLAEGYKLLRGGR